MSSGPVWNWREKEQVSRSTQTPVKDDSGETKGYRDTEKKQSVLNRPTIVSGGGSSSRGSSTPKQSSKTDTTPTKPKQAAAAVNPSAAQNAQAPQPQDKPVFSSLALQSRQPSLIRVSERGYRDTYLQRSVNRPLTESEKSRATTRQDYAKEVIRQSQTKTATKGTISAAPKKSFINRIEAKAYQLRYEARGSQGSQPIRDIKRVGSVGLYALSNLASQAKWWKDLATSPIKTTKETVVGAYQILRHPIQTKESIQSAFLTNPEKATGTTVGMIFGAKLSGVVGSKGLTTTKNIYVKTGSKYVPPENIFSSQVLSGQTNLPKTGSISESLTKFKAGKTEGGYIVTTASPGKIKGDVAGAGRKGGVGLEDPGIYVTPKGEGSPYFLRVSKEMQPIEYSLNPFKGLSETFNLPTITEFKVKQIKRIPQSARDVPGFSGVKTYFEATKDSAAYITKRSEIGLGTTRRQKFKVTEDFDLGTMKGRKGETRMEAGTSELEGVIPVGRPIIQETKKTIFGKIKGFDEYTTFEGRAVAIRKTRIEGEAAKKPRIPGEKIIDPKKIVKETSSTISRPRYKTPSSAIKYAASLSTLKSTVSAGSVSRPMSPISSGSRLPPSSVPTIPSRPNRPTPSRPNLPMIRRQGYIPKPRYPSPIASRGPSPSYYFPPSPSQNNGPPTIPKQRKRRNKDSIIIGGLKESAAKRSQYTPSAFAIFTERKGKQTKAGELSTLYRPIPV